MTLPLILMPPDVPLALIAGFGIAPGSQFDHVQSKQGEARKRRMFTTAPRIVQVSWIVPETVMYQLDDWYENALKAGALDFTIQLQRLGRGLEYWAANWVSPPTAEPIASPDALWRVAGSLLLTGEPSDMPPVTTDLVGDTFVVLNGEADIVQQVPLVGDTTIALVTVLPLVGDTSVVLAVINNGAPASNVDFAKRWIWMRYPYAPGRSADVQDVQEYDQRSWFGA